MFMDRNERKKKGFIICYDKFTKPMAISLSNSISESCVVLDKKHYDAKRHAWSNKNLFLLLNQKLIEENLSNPKTETIHFSEGVILKHEGNTIGLQIDPEYDLSKYEMKTNWGKYIIGTLVPILGVGGVPGAIVVCSFLKYRDNKKKKHMLLFEAVEKLKAETIEKFLRGEQLD